MFELGWVATGFVAKRWNWLSVLEDAEEVVETFSIYPIELQFHSAANFLCLVRTVLGRGYSFP